MGTEPSSLEKNNAPVCSVCIANYNGRDVLEACLRSVYQQDFADTIEVIVHDDASTDGSCDIVREKYPDVRLMTSDSNVGFCISNNRMVNAAKGRYILLLNNDAELYPDALSTIYDYALREKVQGIIGLPQYNMQTGELIDIGCLFDPFLNPVPNLDKSRNNVGMVIGACMWFPRNLWDELGGFPDWFENLAEDMYLCCLARLNGYTVTALPESGYKHWVGKSLGGGKIVNHAMHTTYRRRALSERNKSYVMVLCYPGLSAWARIFFHFMMLMFEGIVLSIVKRDKRIWTDIYQSCLKSVWARRKELIGWRRDIQKKRSASPRSFYSVHAFIPYKLQMLIRHGLPTLK